MDEARPNGGVRVSPVDRRGRRISAAVLHAAEEVARRAISHAERLHIDPAIAANLLEEAAATVSRAMKPQLNQRPVEDLESYLFRAYLRRLNKRHRREMTAAEALQLHAFGSQNSVDPRASLERKIFIDEFLKQCDPVMGDMFCRRIEGFSWKEIGKSHRISSHAAESRFGKTFRKLLRKLSSN